MRELPHGRAHLNRFYYTYRRNAKRRGIAFHLSQEQFAFFVSLNCFYCGSAPENRVDAAIKTHMKMNGIDRLDNSIGYLPLNCVACCAKCNMAKGVLSIEDFLCLIKNIYEYHKNYFVGS